MHLFFSRSQQESENVGFPKGQMFPPLLVQLQISICVC